MKFGPTNSGKLLNVITHNVISTNQTTQSVVYRWLHAHAMFNVMCCPACVGASDVISSVVLICQSEA